MHLASCWTHDSNYKLFFDILSKAISRVCLTPTYRPCSGPMRFEYDEDGERWVNTRDGETELRSILTAEMLEKCGVSLGSLSQ